MSAVLEAPGIPRDRFFYTGMALLAAFTVLVGFAPTFYLRSTDLPPLSPLLVVHGIVLSTWLGLLIVQTSLVAANRRDIHRKLGVAGACLAAAVPVLMTLAAVASLRLGRTPLEGLDPRSFFATPMRDVLTFTMLASAGLTLRRDPETHKRLMLLATIALLDAAIARWPGAKAYGPPAFFGAQDLLIAGALVYDYTTRGRVHRAYKWGAALLVLSQPLVLVISKTRLWLAFADWVLAL